MRQFLEPSSVVSLMLSGECEFLNPPVAESTS